MKRIALQPRVHLNMMRLEKFKTNYICFELRMPLAEQTASLYNLVPKVLDRGCEQYPDLVTLSRRTEELYGTGIYAYSYKLGENQTIALAAYPLANEYAIDGMDIFSETIHLMEQMLFEPKLKDGMFLSEYVESEKKNLIDSIRAEINNKARYAFNRALREMCKGETFAIPGTGTIEQVEAVTPRALTDAYYDILKNAQIEIWAVGRFEEEALTAELSRIFSRIPESTACNIETSVKRKAEGEIKEIDEEQPMKQGNLVMGFRTGRILADGADYTPFVVFVSLYGSGTTSKLFVHVRERLSLCYYCSASADAFKGLMHVQSGIEKKNFEVAKKEILAQLEAVKTGDFTDEDLENAKICLINRYRAIEDESGSIKNWYANRLLANRSDSPADAANAVMAVTREQVMEAARGVSLDTVYFLHGSDEETVTTEEEA